MTSEDAEFCINWKWLGCNEQTHQPWSEQTKFYFSCITRSLEQASAGFGSVMAQYQGQHTFCLPYLVASGSQAGHCKSKIFMFSELKG